MRSGTRQPLRVAAWIPNALSVTAAVLATKNAACPANEPCVTSNVPCLRVAGSSADSVPEKPLPNWAV
jgi:hypothetical protein